MRTTSRPRIRQLAVPTVWLATPDGLVCIDSIAVERAVKGQRSGWTLTEDEARYAAGLMLDSNVPYSVVSKRVGVNAVTLRAWFPEAAPQSELMARPGDRARKEPPKCGTRRGYYRHHRYKETPCKPCKAANAAADRYYRLHGTYEGAPEVAA